VVSSRQQADGSRQYLTQMFFLSVLLLPAAYCLLPASLQLCMLKAIRIVSWKRMNRGLVAQRHKDHGVFSVVSVPLRCERIWLRLFNR
jgi:hypothetical protein